MSPDAPTRADAAAPRAARTPDRLPDGFRVALRPDVRRLDGGRLLVGGSPMRAMRLSPAALAVLGDGGFVVTDDRSAALAASLLRADVAEPVLDPAPVAADLLTVVLPVRDRCDQLDRALGALGRACRVLVVDDASHDPAAVAAVARRHGVEVLALAVNVGPGGARNAGLAHVRTPYVAFVDCDVTVGTDLLLRLARHLLDPTVALVGPRVVGRARSTRVRWWESYDEVASSLGLGARGGVVRPGAAVGWLPAACLVGRVADLGEGFEPGLRVAEDVDLVWRLDVAGRTVRYDAGERVDHDARATVRGWLGRKVLYGTGGALLAQRHGDRGAPAVLSPELALAAAALLLRRRWSAPVAALAVARGAHALATTLPEAPERPRLAAGLTARGLGWAVRQETGLLLRHWWPLTVVGAALSRDVRRAVVSALVVDLAVGVREHPRADPRLLLLGRRLDDLAYGTGLWLGALRARSPRCLLPRSPRSRR
ncbi:mycofactocin biosynthesis glycosyltransferase MftF [Nocardioides sp. P86]|uniref:mycofactocin biosynthesis glycosyltransferase MftF n=1 Tax=Nocardioides sp. P86 TaxID=2939569 RepID=UPI00203F5C9D|nr:mycofactocin biosynthesis glycosyltransferase MftF [Nocardioides sp. P86]MCM3516639.1 mycofactocin biosynthesis glycosyltransferase MftF [Nocardioides sp. P86]